MTPPSLPRLLSVLAVSALLTAPLSSTHASQALASTPSESMSTVPIAPEDPTHTRWLPSEKELPPPSPAGWMMPRSGRVSSRAIPNVGTSPLPATATPPAGWECEAKYSTACITPFGYTGQSGWGHWTDQWGNNCTNYAAWRVAANGVPNPGRLGDAGDWDENARALGYPVNDTPAVGAVAQWNIGDYGHVGYVDWVSPDGNTIATSESGYDTKSFPSMSRRQILKRGVYGWPSNFIHFKDMAPSGGDAPTTSQALDEWSDLNHDGRGDVIGIDAAGVLHTYYQRKGAWDLVDGVTKAGHGLSGNREMHVTPDVNGDGVSDMIGVAANDVPWIYYGTKAGDFYGGQNVIGGSWAGMDLLTPVPDMDGNGRPEVVARNTGSGELMLYSMNENGYLARGTKIGSGWGGARHLFIVNAPGSSLPALAGVFADGVLRRYTFSVSGRAVQGVTGGEAVGHGWGSRNEVFSAGDMTGDGKRDIIGRDSASGNLMLYPSKGDDWGNSIAISGNFNGIRIAN